MIMIMAGSASYGLVIQSAGAGSDWYSRSLSQNCSEAAEAPPHHSSWAHIYLNWCSLVLARESHAFFLHQSLYLTAYARFDLGFLKIRAHIVKLESTAVKMVTKSQTHTRIPGAKEKRLYRDTDTMNEVCY